MPLAYKPHSVSISRGSGVYVADALVFTEHLAPTETQTGMFSRKTPEWMFQNFGIEVTQPAIFMMDTNDIELKSGDWLVFGGKNWVVKTFVVHDAEPMTAHCVVALEQVENAG